MTNKHDLLRAVADGAQETNATQPLDPNCHWDKRILDEAALLQKWTGIKAALCHTSDGTAARSDNTVLVDRNQLDQLFAFTSQKYETAIFFALAHEFGHLCQFNMWGVDHVFSKERMEIEAHADYLAGIWLGLRLTQGSQRLSEDVFSAAIELKSASENYPTAYQRGCLVQEAMGRAVMLVHIIEDQLAGTDPYEKLEVAIGREDVDELFEISTTRLGELPRDATWQAFIKRGVFGQTFRRV